MNLKSIAIAAMLLGYSFAMPIGSASAEPAVNIPASVVMEHDSVMGYLRKIAERTTPTGAAARDLIEVFKKHMTLEEQFILPPLTLLPSIAAGKITPDMRWAIPMGDRVRTEKDHLQQVHDGITIAILALKDAADAEHDEATVGFSSDLAADDLADVEITEPTVIIISDILRSKLPPQ